MTPTKGPWAVGAGRTIATPSGEFYLNYGKDKHGNPLFKDFCELDANARLIAAAPDMINLLERIAKSACLEQVTGGQCICFSCESARIIAKAEGRA